MKENTNPVSQYLRILGVLSIITIICIAIGVVSHHISGHSATIEARNEYYNKTEALLDSIHKWDESFMDSVMETDSYYEYEVARENLR